MADTGLKFIPHMNTKSCCCFSSKTGCLIVGYSGAIGILFVLIVTAVLHSEDWDRTYFHLIYLICIGIFNIHYSLIQGVKKQEPRKMFYWIYPAYIILIIAAFIIKLSIILSFVALVISKSLDDLLPTLWCFILIIITGLFYHIFASVVTHCQDLILIQSGQRILTA